MILAGAHGVLIWRNTLRYCALRGLSAANNCFEFPGLRRFADNPGYINMDYSNPENETAADGRRLHFDITLRGQAGRARRCASPNSPTNPEPNSQKVAGTGTGVNVRVYWKLPVGPPIEADVPPFMPA
jgi:hypothetical protein